MADLVDFGGIAINLDQVTFWQYKDDGKDGKPYLKVGLGGSSFLEFHGSNAVAMVTYLRVESRKPRKVGGGP